MTVATVASTMLFTPSVHKALLSNVSPKVSSIETQGRCKVLIDSWEGHDYRNAAASGVRELKAEDFEIPNDGQCGPLPFMYVKGNAEYACVVYPEVRAKLPGGMTIKARTRTDIPTKNGAAAKNWTSADVHYDESGGLEALTVGLSELPNTLKRLEGIAGALSEWERKRMVNAGERWQCEFSEPSPLEISTIAVRDEKLRNYLQLIKEGDSDLHKLLTQPAARKLLSAYFVAAGLDGRGTDEPILAWRIRSGCLPVMTNPPPALYLVYRKGATTKAVGIVYDCSPDVEMAAAASEKIERFLKPTI